MVLSSTLLRIPQNRRVTALFGDRRSLSFIRKLKAAAKALVQDPKNTIGEIGTRESPKTRAASGASLEDQFGYKGRNWSFIGSVINFGLRQIDKAVGKNMESVDGIIFKAAQVLESDPKIVAILGPMVKITAPSLKDTVADNSFSGGTYLSISSVNINGNSRMKYDIGATVTGVSSSGRINASAPHRLQIVAYATGDKTNIEAMQLHCVDGRILNIEGDGRGWDGSTGKVTIDVEGK